MWWRLTRPMRFYLWSRPTTLPLEIMASVKMQSWPSKSIKPRAEWGVLEQHPQFYAALLQGVCWVVRSYRETPRFCSQRPGSRSQFSMEDHQSNPFNEYNWRRTVVARVQQSNHSCRLRQQLRPGKDIRCRVQGDLHQQKILVANGEKGVLEEELAMMFLFRLDMTRYGAKYTEMQNDGANRKEC